MAARAAPRRRGALRSCARSRPGAKRRVLVPQGPRPAPVAARDRHQRPFTQRERDILVRAASSPTLIPSSRAASPPSRSPQRTRAIPCRIAGPAHQACVANLRTASSASAAHLLGPVPHRKARSTAAHASVKDHRPGRVPVLPAIDRVACRSASTAAPSTRTGRGQHRGHQGVLRSRPVLQPSEPPLAGWDLRPCRWAGTASFSTRPAAASTSLSRHRVTPAPPRASRSARTSRRRGAQDRIRPAPGAPARPGACRGTVWVAVPLPRRSSGTSSKFDRARSPGSRRTAQLEHRIAQRPGQALQHRSPGEEHPLPAEIRARNSDSMYSLTSRSRRRRRPPRCQGAALPQVKSRQVQPGRPALGPPMQLGHLISLSATSALSSSDDAPRG